MYIPGVYLHWGVYCAYERGLSLSILSCLPLHELISCKKDRKRPSSICELRSGIVMSPVLKVCQTLTTKEK